MPLPLSPPNHLHLYRPVDVLEHGLEQTRARVSARAHARARERSAPSHSHERVCTLARAHSLPHASTSERVLIKGPDFSSIFSHACVRVRSSICEGVSWFGCYRTHMDAQLNARVNTCWRDQASCESASERRCERVCLSGVRMYARAASVCVRASARASVRRCVRVDDKSRRNLSRGDNLAEARQQA
eukprot:6207022-Pleurochrysis_carterae.AAC.1